jgi:hypothetical protein
MPAVDVAVVHTELGTDDASSCCPSADAGAGAAATAGCALSLTGAATAAFAAEVGCCGAGRKVGSSGGGRRAGAEGLVAAGWVGGDDDG